MKCRDCRTSLARALAAFFVIGEFLAGLPPSARAEMPRTGCCKREGLEPKIEAAIDEFRASVPALLGKADVPGAALALVDDQGIVWTEGFGRLGAKKKEPVTPDTPFLLGGMSKLITVTAVLRAAQDGLVKLDEPITTYLPDFQMNSRYEQHPEHKITLRHLLNFTAGLPVETPLGNSFEPASTASFEEHVKSLYGSWMVCPVGHSFHHSDASCDLAAYLIGTVAGKPYPDYLHEKIFSPLGMSNTAADCRAILENPQRAIGHMMGIAKMPPVYPALGACGIYSTARDMARFVQLHINQGMLEGRTFIERSLLDATRTPVGIARTEPNMYYGQGLYIDKRPPERTETVLGHDGVGFGFLSLMHWYPEYGIGMVVLTNRVPNSAFSDLALGLTDKLVKGKLLAKRFPLPEPQPCGCLSLWRGWSAHQPTPYRPEWQKHCGTHNLRFSEYALEWWAHVAILVVGRDEYTPRIQIREKDGFLCLTESKFFEQVAGFRAVDEKLQEVRPGVFTTQAGRTLDFTRAVPTWCSYHLEK